MSVFNQPKVLGKGPRPSQILILGEAPSSQDEVVGEPFTGTSGNLFTSMLREAGIDRVNCYVTNVVKYKPPKNDVANWFTSTKSDATKLGLSNYENGAYFHPAVAEGLKDLTREIAEANPALIIAAGNLPLWATTGYLGVTSWRGSVLWSDRFGCKVVPVYPPSSILRMWEWKPIAVHDLRRAKSASETRGLADPGWNFLVRPSFSSTMEVLSALTRRADTGLLHISADIETIAHQFACLGLAWSKTESITIPFFIQGDHYFSEEEEVAVYKALKALLTHPNVRVTFQNGLYDVQYFIRDLLFLPNVSDDTMLQQHCAYPGMTKGLDFLSSMYCAHHVYWKDDLKDYKRFPADPEKFWRYNSTDCVRTYEIREVLSGMLDKLNLTPQYRFQMRLWRAALAAMVRGVNIDKALRGRLAEELMSAIDARQNKINSILGHELNVRSPKKMQELIYGDLKQPVIKNRKTGQPTLDDRALDRIYTREPLLRPLLQPIRDIRHLGVFLSTFVQMPLDSDGRMRSTFNPAGTETFRFSSSTNAFGTGGNLQNLPSGDEDDEHSQGLPNIRKLFIPDRGYVIFEADLDRADLQVVIWEADDDDLKAAIREGVDIHLLNAGVLFGLRDLTRENLRDPEFTGRVKKQFHRQRQFAKVFVHGTNYGGSARTMATNTGVSVRESEESQRAWFRAHPGILDWHTRTKAQLLSDHCVYNRFGYRRFYFDRADSILPEALAWVPQSTVACVCNRAWVNIHEAWERGFPVEVLLQVHDSLVMQSPSGRYRESLPELARLMSIQVPYKDPLVISWGLKSSTKSWGDAEPDSWT